MRPGSGDEKLARTKRLSLRYRTRVLIMLDREHPEMRRLGRDLARDHRRRIAKLWSVPK